MSTKQTSNALLSNLLSDVPSVEPIVIVRAGLKTLILREVKRPVNASGKSSLSLVFEIVKSEYPNEVGASVTYYINDAFTQQILPWNGEKRAPFEVLVNSIRNVYVDGTLDLVAGLNKMFTAPFEATYSRNASGFTALTFVHESGLPKEVTAEVADLA